MINNIVTQKLVNYASNPTSVVESLPLQELAEGLSLPSWFSDAVKDFTTRVAGNAPSSNLIALLTGAYAVAANPTLWKAAEARFSDPATLKGYVNSSLPAVLAATGLDKLAFNRYGVSVTTLTNHLFGDPGGPSLLGYLAALHSLVSINGELNSNAFSQLTPLYGRARAARLYVVSRLTGLKPSEVNTLLPDLVAKEAIVSDPAALAKALGADITQPRVLQQSDRPLTMGLGNYFEPTSELQPQRAGKGCLGAPKPPGGYERKTYFTVKDAEDAIQRLLLEQPASLVAVAESMIRFETGNFTSYQYRNTGSAGMEVGRWKGIKPSVLTYWGCDPRLGWRKYILWRHPYDALNYMIQYVKRYDGYWPYWHARATNERTKYHNAVSKVIPHTTIALTTDTSLKSLLASSASPLKTGVVDAIV